MILLHPYAQRLKNGLPNAKTPPVGWWQEVIAALDEPIVQIGVAGEDALVPDVRLNLPLVEVARLVDRCTYWISPDSFLPHLARHVGRSGVVIWSRSDPLIFGYPENLNLLKDRQYLRAQQFAVWEDCAYDPEAFLDPALAVAQIRARHSLMETV